MKEGHYLLIFFAVIIVSYLALDHRTEALSVMSQKKEVYSNGAEEALITAYEKSLERFNTTSKQLIDNYDVNNSVFSIEQDRATFKDSTIEYFFKELYAKYSAYRNEPQQIRIQNSFPVIAFVDVDGIYVNYITQNADGKVYRVFSDKIKWGVTNSPLKNCKKDSKEYYTYLAEIENVLNYFINNFGNRGAPLQEGARIVLQDVISEETYIGKELVGIYAISLTEGAYDEKIMNYRLANLTKVTLADIPCYVINKNKSTGILEYHVDTCEKAETGLFIETTKENCAKKGAYPCAECQP